MRALAPVHARGRVWAPAFAGATIGECCRFDYSLFSPGKRSGLVAARFLARSQLLAPSQTGARHQSSISPVGPGSGRGPTCRLHSRQEPRALPRVLLSCARRAPRHRDNRCDAHHEGGQHQSNGADGHVPSSCGCNHYPAARAAPRMVDTPNVIGGVWLNGHG